MALHAKEEELHSSKGASTFSVGRDQSLSAAWEVSSVVELWN